MTKAGGTLKEQLEKMPAVKLQLSDGTMYSEEGKIDAVSGVIDQTTGSVSMRAISRTSRISFVVEVWPTWYSHTL